MKARRHNLWGFLSLIAALTILGGLMLHAADKTVMIQSDVTKGIVAAATYSAGSGGDTLVAPGGLKVHTDDLVVDPAGGISLAPANGAATLTGTLAVSSTFTFNGMTVGKVSEAIAVGDFTDGGSTSGYLDLSSDVPAGALVFGFTFVGSGAFDGDTSAVMEVGISGDTDAFAALTTGSVFAAATVGSGANADAAFCASATTPRVTVTTAADFTSCKSSGNGAGTVTIWYIKPSS